MKFLKKILFLVLLLAPTSFIFAIGNIDTTNHKAILKNDNSTINFGYFTTNSDKNVTVTDSSLSGYIWGENIGWISLNCSNNSSCGDSDFKVSNTTSGVLSGFAWGENAGWVNFGPFDNSATETVVIDADGNFNGYAWSQNFGWIEFDCDVLASCVNTTWRPNGGGGGGGGGGGNFCELNPQDPSCISSGGGDTPVDDDGGPSGGGGPVDDGGGGPGDNDGPFDVDPTGGGDNFPPDDGGGQVFNPPTGCEYETNILNVIWCIIIDTYDYTIDTFTSAFSEMKDILNNDSGNLIIKTIGIVGLLFGAIFSVFPKLFGTPLSFTEIWMLPYRLWSALMSAFGIKKRARPWGTVYDSVTKQPLDPVMVSLQDLEGKEIQSSITDMDGRYGFLVEPGKYRLLPKKTHYSFPSLKLVGKTRDEIYLDLYFGDVFEVSRAGDVIIKNIPMDPIGFDWNEFAKRDQKLMKYYSKRDVFLTKLSDSFFSFGFTVACLAIVSSFSTYNILVFCLYLILLFLRETGIKTKNFGKILDVEGNPISFAIIKVYNSDTNTLISKKVANKYGQYYCLMPQGNYFVEIDQKLADESYKTIFKSGVINANKGYINNVFKIKL